MINSLQAHKDEILALWDSGKYESHSELARHVIGLYGNFGRHEDSIRRTISNWISIHVADEELIYENVRLAKDKQRLQDIQRIERKSFREYARIENAVSTVGKALFELNKSVAKELASNININPINRSNELSGVGVIQITDVHFNELIDLPHNKYNFKIAARRLKKLTQESLDYFKYKRIKKVVLAYTGDLLNSSRRLDEIINAETNRVKSAALGAHIIRQQILHARNAGYEIDIVSVLGNESRVEKEMTFSNEAFSDNFDFTIMAQVKDVITNMGIDGINFISIDKMETVLNLGEYNVLFSHGINLLNSKQKDIQSVIGKYSNQGVKVDYIIYGHGHAFRGTDLSCQASSLCGANTYSDHALGLAGRASGTCHTFINKDHSLQYVDLQESGEDGYEIISQLEAYHVKSHEKIKPIATVFQVVI